MVINGITFSNDRYGAGTTDFLLGNIGDLITAQVTFTVSGAATAFDYFFNLIPNSEGVYAQTLTVPTSAFELPNSRFNNAHTNTLQSFRGGIGTLNIANPTNWNTGSATVTSLGGNQYRITHTFLITPLLQATGFVVDDYTVPTWFNGLESLKYLFRIDCRTNINDPSVFDSTNTIDISSFVKNGNVGFLNERFNNIGNADYTLVANSLQYNGGNASAINPAVNTIVTFQIKNNAGAFATTHKLGLVIQEVKDDFNNTQNYLLNLKADRVLLTANGVAVNGSYVNAVSATINAGDNTLLDVTLTVPPNTYTAQYAIFTSVVANIANVSNANHNNVFVTQNEATQSANGASVEMALPSGCNFAEFNFIYHYTDDLSNSFNHVKSFVEDRFKCIFKVFASDVNTTLQTVVCGIKRLSNGAVLETQRFNLSQVPINRAKNWKIKDTDFKATYKVDDDGSGYVIEYPFQIANNWTSFADLVFYAQIIATENGISVTKEFQSPYFVLQTYDLTLNTGAEPILTRPPATIEYFALPSVTPIQGLLRGGKTLVVATFEEDNLNDLESTQAQLVGYFGINVQNGGLPVYRQFHSIFEPEADTPFEPDTTFTSANNSYVNKVDIDTVELRGVIDWNRLVQNVGIANCYDITARMDRRDPATFRFYDLPFHFRSPYLNWLSWQIPTAISTASLTEIFSTIPLTSLRFKLNNNNVSWGSVPYLTTVQFLAQVATRAVGDWIYIETTQTTYIDGGVILRFLDRTDPVVPSVDTYTYSTIDDDHIWWFDTKVTINTIVNTNSSAAYIALRTDTPQNQDYTAFILADASGIATINAQINALPDGTKYGIHIHSRLTAATGTTQLTVTYQTASLKRQLIDSVGSSSNPQYRPFVNAWQTDGINDAGLRSGIGYELYPDEQWSYSGWHRVLTNNVAFGSNMFWEVRWANSDTIGTSAGVTRVQFVYAISAQEIRIVFTNAGLVSRHRIFYPMTLDKWYHIAIIKVSGFGVGADKWKVYVNGMYCPPTALDNNVVSLPARTQTLRRHYLNVHGFPLDFPNSYLNARDADFRWWSGYNLSVKEIRELFNGDYQTNVQNSNLLYRLPMTLPSHFSATQLLDTSGNGFNFDVLGQAPTPTTVPFY